jgi:hypothetical protein
VLYLSNLATGELFFDRSSTFCCSIWPLGAISGEDSAAVRPPNLSSPQMNSPNLFYEIILSAPEQNVDFWQSLHSSHSRTNSAPSAKKVREIDEYFMPPFFSICENATFSAKSFDFFNLKECRHQIGWHLPFRIELSRSERNRMATPSSS